MGIWWEFGRNLKGQKQTKTDKCGQGGLEWIKWGRVEWTRIGKGSAVEYIGTYRNASERSRVE